MLRYLTIPVTQFQQNCSLVWCDETLQAAVIDPGGDLPPLLQAVKRLSLTLAQIWQTHAHIDQAQALAAGRRHGFRGPLPLGCAALPGPPLREAMWTLPGTLPRPWNL